MPWVSSLRLDERKITSIADATTSRNPDFRRQAGLVYLLNLSRSKSLA